MRASLLFLVPAVGVLAATQAPAHAGPALRFSPDSPPGLRRTELLTTQLERVTARQRGWNDCVKSMDAATTTQPLVTFDLDAAMPLRIRIESSNGNPVGPAAGAVLVLPDRRYVCADGDNQFRMERWPKGHYELYLTSNQSSLNTHVTFEDPVRSARALADALGKLPVISLGDAGVANPRHQVVPATIAVDTREAGPSCVSRGRVMPLAQIQVSRAGAWYVGVPSTQLFVITADNKCLSPSGTPGLPAGTHTLWTAVPISGGPVRYELELDDRNAGLAFLPAEQREVGELATPLVLAGKVRASEHWSERVDRCRGAARAPDFYLHSDRPLQRVSMWTLWAKQRQRIHVFGPIEQKGDDLRCDDKGSGHAFDVFEGTYAVWVGGDDVGADYRLVIQREDAPADPFTTFAQIPETLTIDDRAIEHHYPYFRNRPITDWTRLFTSVPDRMFVYTRAPVESLPEGEPLLVASSDDARTSVYRYDGRRLTIDTRLVGTTPPAKVVLPARPTVPDLRTFNEARAAAGPEDQPLLAKHRELQTKFGACLGAYIRKNDPTAGHDHSVYRISGNRVVNVGDQVAEAGARRCGGPQLHALEQSLIKKLAKAREAHYAANLAAVRKRFAR